MNGHRSAIKKGGQSLLHRHFHQPDHSVDDMRVQILEEVYHSSENPTLLTSLRRTRELFWIKELGTAKPHGFNDQIKGVGTLSSISCKKTNIYSLFNKQPRRKRSHGKRRYNKRAPQPDVTMSTLVDVVDMIEKPEGVHKINTKLFSISFPNRLGRASHNTPFLLHTKYHSDVRRNGLFYSCQCQKSIGCKTCMPCTYIHTYIHKIFGEAGLIVATLRLVWTCH